ncbi:MAG: TonB-dependent receptor [Alphaproteobacteria bacterium]
MPQSFYPSFHSAFRGQGAASRQVLMYAAVCLATTCLTGPGYAQETEPTTLPPITVEGQESDGYKTDKSSSPKLQQPLIDTPRTINVIPAELIEDRGATSLQEIMRTQPGITLDAAEGGAPFSDRLFIRGFGASDDMFVDGVRDRSPQFRDPFNLEQIEISKGPGSAYSGRGSTGGTINMVTKAPRAENFARGDITIGNADTKRATIDFNQDMGNGQALRVNALAHDGGIAGRDDAIEVERWGFAPSYVFGLGRPTQLTVSYYHLEQDSVPDYGHPFDPATGLPVAVDRENFYGILGRDFQHSENDTLSARLDHKFSDTLSLVNNTRITSANNDYIVTKPNYTGGATVERQVRGRDDENIALSNQTDFVMKFERFGVKHDLTTGLELAREISRANSRDFADSTGDFSGSANSNAPPADLFNPNPNDPYTGLWQYTTSTETTGNTVALYVFDHITLSDQWEILGGLRWDHFDASNDTISRTDRLWSYQTGVVYKPLPNGSIYLAHAVSYNPSAESISLSSNNVNTDPEKTNSYEIGTKWDLLDGRINVSAALFRTEKTDARVSTGGGQPQILAGKQRVDGIELGVSGRLTPAWRVYGGYTLLDTEIEDDGPSNTTDGNEFAEVAPQIFSIWSTYDVNRDWTVGGGAYYSAERQVHSSNVAQFPSYWRFDAMARYRVTEKVDLRLNVLNLFDETYYDSNHSTQFAYVAPGRTVLMTVGFSF